MWLISWSWVYPSLTRPFLFFSFFFYFYFFLNKRKEKYFGCLSSRLLTSCRTGCVARADRIDRVDDTSLSRTDANALTHRPVWGYFFCLFLFSNEDGPSSSSSSSNLLTIHWPSRLPSTLVRDAPPTCPEGYEGMCPWLVINCNQTSCLLCCHVSLSLSFSIARNWMRPGLW